MEKVILLIDDDPDETIIFSEALLMVDEKMKLLYAASAESGLKMVENLKPDFIFLDMNMPSVNGMECLLRIKNMNLEKRIPIIIYSTGITNMNAQRVLNDGATACIKKTTSIEALADLLRILFK